MNDDARAGIVVPSGLLDRERVAALYDVQRWCDLLQDAIDDGQPAVVVEGTRDHLRNAVNVALSLLLPNEQVNAMLDGGPAVLLYPEQLPPRQARERGRGA